ncbi:unnamed protein product, partial [Rotaria sp. Silwood2]
LEKIDTLKISITDTSNSKIPFSVLRDEDLQTYFFTAEWKPGMKYKLTIEDSTLSDLVGNYNKKQQFSFSVTSVKKADNSGKVLDKRILRDSQSVKIDYGLQFAGNYSVEIIDDENGDGIWNSGNFATKTLPEKIYKELKQIIIKENWDAEENIIVDFSGKELIPNNNAALNKLELNKSKLGNPGTQKE